MDPHILVRANSEELIILLMSNTTDSATMSRNYSIHINQRERTESMCARAQSEQQPAIHLSEWRKLCCNLLFATELAYAPNKRSGFESRPTLAAYRVNDDITQGALNFRPTSLTQRRHRPRRAAQQLSRRRAPHRLAAIPSSNALPRTVPSL